MWGIFFTMTFSGMLISTMTQDKPIWNVVFCVLMLICIVGQIITEDKEEKRIKELEKKIEEMVGEDKGM